MKSDSVETEFKDRLKNREIEPSSASWDRLNILLDESENLPAQNKKRMGLYVAASVIGFIFLGMLFFNSQREELMVPTQKVVLDVLSAVDSVERSHPDYESKNQILKKKSTIAVASTIQFNSNQSKKLQQLNQVQVIEEVSIIDQQLINHQKEIVIHEKSTASIDFLLKEAELGLVKENTKPKQEVKVNASSLLSQVDTELEPSFREKVIDKVSKNYHAVKVAIVNRNVKE